MTDLERDRARARWRPVTARWWWACSPTRHTRGGAARWRTTSPTSSPGGGMLRSPGPPGWPLERDGRRSCGYVSGEPPTCMISV